MGLDVEAPFLEIRDLVLLLADDNGHFGRFHPVDFPALLESLLLSHLLELVLLFLDGLFPVLLHVFEHHHGGHLVHTNEHGLSGFPYACVVSDEVLRNLTQSGFGHDHVYAVREFALDLFGLLVIEIGSLYGIK